jgi:hypothetical protein
MLGPLAFLLFFVKGIVSSNEQQRKCPFCAEWIRPEATVCKHCHKNVPVLTPAAPRPGVAILKGVLTLIVAVVFLGLIAVLVFNPGGPSGASSTLAGSVYTAVEPTVTIAEFNKLQSGMTYQQAVEIIGAAGEEMSRSDIAGYTTVMYAWKNGDGSNMNAMFQNGELINKAQFGLR